MKIIKSGLRTKMAAVDALYIYICNYCTALLFRSIKKGGMT